jgi:hypothetical protein
LYIGVAPIPSLASPDFLLFSSETSMIVHALQDQGYVGSDLCGSDFEEELFDESETGAKTPSTDGNDASAAPNNKKVGLPMSLHSFIS